MTGRASDFGRGYFESDAADGSRRSGYAGSYERVKASAPDAARRRLDRIDAQGVRGGRWLEVGCAYGYILPLLEGYDVTGVDVSPHAVARAAREAPDATVDVLDMTSPWPFADRSFDVIAFDNVLEHVTRPHFAIAEATRVLRDDGLLYVVLPNRLGDLRFWESLLVFRWPPLRWLLERVYGPLCCDETHLRSPTYFDLPLWFEMFEIVDIEIDPRTGIFRHLGSVGRSLGSTIFAVRWHLVLRRRPYC